MRYLLLRFLSHLCKFPPPSPSYGLAHPPLFSSDPVLPSSIILSQSPMKARVVSEMFSKKNDDGALCQDFVGNPNLDVVESQLACLNQIYEGINSLKTLLSMPIKAPNLVIDYPVEAEFSSLGGFQIEGLSPNKIARVHVVLSSLDLKVYSRRKNRFSTGI